MKLYKITQDVNDGYDTFDSAIVCAESEEEARNINIGSDLFNEWASPSDVKVKYIGEAAEGTKKGIVLASFNAG